MKIIKTNPGSEEWLKIRKNCLGGSDVGTALGLLPFKSPVEVFYDKIGRKKTEGENETMFHGTNLEDYVGRLWKYYDPATGDYMENYRQNKIIRKSRKVNGIAWNPDYPWLSGSFDRLFTSDSKTHVLEIKTISGFYLKQWKDSLPPYYLAQIYTYMIIAEAKRAELAILEDGRKFQVFPIERKEDFAELIITKTKDFWYNRVEAAKKIITEISRTKDIDQIQKLEHRIMALEPPPDATPAYAAFLNEKYTGKPETMPGTILHMKLAQEAMFLQAVTNELSTVVELRKNQIKNEMKECEEIDLKEGKIRWKARKNAKTRTLNFHLSPVFTEQEVKEEAAKIKFEW